MYKQSTMANKQYHFVEDVKYAIIVNKYLYDYCYFYLQLSEIRTKTLISKCIYAYIINIKCKA